MFLLSLCAQWKARIKLHEYQQHLLYYHEGKAACHTQRRQLNLIKSERMCVQNRKHSSLLLGGSWRAAAQIPRASAEENKPQPEYSPRPPTPTLTGGLRSPNEKEGFDELSCSQTQLNKDSDNWQTGWPQKDSWRWHGGADEGEQRREGDQNKALLPPGP